MILSPFIYKQTHRKKLQGELDKTDTRSDGRDKHLHKDTMGHRRSTVGWRGISKTKLMEDGRR